ncbi:MAG TPA: hypothetical protein VGY56_10160, partial [Verrucomicrobiae bacterium]|nr:hypothetical protein [Verrucomicrobiae bacterium]
MRLSPVRSQTAVVFTNHRTTILPLPAGEGRGELLYLPSSIFLLLFIVALSFTSISTALAEQPGEYRPQPVLHPIEKCGATGDVVEPPDEFPVSRAPLVNTAHRKPKLANPGEPTLRGNELVFNAGWEMIEAPKLTADGSTLSQPGVDTANWYDATVPGTVLTTLVNEGVYPDPYFGLNNRL